MTMLEGGWECNLLITTGKFFIKKKNEQATYKKNYELETKQ